MAIHLVDPLTFQNLKPTDKEQVIYDGDGLYIRIRSKAFGGVISFRLRYTFNKKQAWLNLKETTLKKAREECDYYNKMVKQGIDPNLEKRLEKARKKQKQLDELEAIAKLQARMTVRDLFVNWCEIDLIARKDKKEIIRMFEKDVLPDLGNLFVEDIRKGHIALLIAKLKKREVLHLARNLLKLTRQMFRFAVTNDIIEFDPTASLSIAKTTTKPTERERNLSELEIKALARQLPEANLLLSTECAIWICLSTICRIGELSKAKFSDIDFENKTWTIPKENSKNKKALTVFLSEFALEQFLKLKEFSTHETWVFPNRNGSNHVCEKSITKQIGGRQTENIMSNRSKENQALVLTGGKWTPHDLRRTGATLMGDLDISSDVIDKCLNHTQENKMKRIYLRQKLEAQQAHAWRVLGDRLYILTNTEQSNVVLFKSGGRA